MKHIKVYIYHDYKNRMLVVNTYLKLFYITSDKNIIKLFSSEYTQMNIYSISYSSIIDLIDQFKYDGFKQLF